MQKLKLKELNRLSIDDFKKSEKTPLIVVLDNIRSLNNIGSVFRTSDAFAIEKIYLCGIAATPPNKEIHKTALGATESVAWEYVEDTLSLIKKLKQEGIYTCAIEQAKESIMLQDFNVSPQKKYAIVMGNEVKGVQQEVINNCDVCLEIPQFGTKHSLNISVTTGVVLWDLLKKFRF